MPNPSLGVLLPVRIETVFDQPSAWQGAWRLRVIVVPDAPSIDRLADAAQAELIALKVMWSGAEGNVGTKQGEEAFARLAASLGGARAAWLMRTFPPLRDAAGNMQLDAEDQVMLDETAPVRTQPQASKIRGFPPTIELWFARSDDLSLPLERLAQLDINVGALNIQLDTLDQPQWFSHWEEAQKVGLGKEINLATAGISHPSEITVLIAVGIGDDRAVELFQHHRDSGQLAFMKPGTPTNTISGTATVEPLDAKAWLEHALSPVVTPAVSDLANVLGGQPGDLVGMPDSSQEPNLTSIGHRQLNQVLVQSLWSAVWGHGLQDIWGVDGMHSAGVWACENLFPEGPLPPLRVGDLPYGILPVTSLKRWTSSPNDPSKAHQKVEEELRQWLFKLRSYWAINARAHGTVEGADSERLLELLGHMPHSENFAYRFFFPLHIPYSFSQAFGTNVKLADLFDQWEKDTEFIREFPVKPMRAYGTRGWANDLRLPLVEPDDKRFAEALDELLATLRPDEPDGFAGRYVEAPFPNSLFFRLWTYSLLLAHAELSRRAQGQSGSVMEPIVSSDERSAVWQLVDQMNSNLLNDPNMQDSPQIALWKMSLRASRLRDEPIANVERVLRATLDCAGNRLDPWITGIAWRRLQFLRQAGVDTGLGIYGWVDHPFAGQRGPTSGGLLHAPTEAQARAAIILRDKAVYDPEANRWQINLNSEKVRLAKQIADQVRAGSHIAEALGRMVEQVAGDRSIIEHLRQNYPLREEHAGRRVCDGQKVLAEPDPSKLHLSEEQLASLDLFRDVVDAYGDLLVADAVFNVVTGKPDVAGRVMDAAAGLALPPEMEVLKTKRLGWSLTTTVLNVLRDAPAPVDLAPGVSPGEIAEPAVARFLFDQLGSPESTNWTWRFERAGGELFEVTLALLGLVPVDTLALSPDELALLVRSQLPIGDKPWQLVGTNGKATHQRARELVTALAHQPVLHQDLFADAPESERKNLQAADQVVAAELRARYTRLLEVAGQLALELGQMMADDATEPAQRGALQHATRWGIVPTPIKDDTLLDRVARAKESFDTRVATAPTPGGIEALLTQLEQALLPGTNEQAQRDALAASIPFGAVTTPLQGESPADQVRRMHLQLAARPRLTALSGTDVAAALGELAAPGGKLPIFSRLPMSALKARGLEIAPALEQDWLEVIAAVRSSLARIEGAQIASRLDGATLFDTYCNRKNDPWQVDVVKKNEQQFSLGQEYQQPSTMVAAFAAPGALGENTGPLAALGLVDSWGETVPRQHHTTTAAFGFNAPASRAPQAILIAVPPEDTAPLDAATLADIVMETRELAHARMATPDDLAALAEALPITFLSNAGRAGVSLEET